VDQGVDMKYFLEQLISELHQMLLVEIGVNGSPKLEVRSYKLEVNDIKELVELLAKAHAELKYAVLPQLPLELAIVEWGLGGALRSPRQFDDSSNSISPHSANLARANESEHGSKDASFKSSSHAEAPRAAGTDSFWQELINKVKAYNHSIAGVLRGCKLQSYDNKKIVIETGYKFHKERLNERKTREIIEKVCKEISGKTIGVSVLLKEQK